MLTKAGLLGRGWTDAGIRLFLGDPDDMKVNPIFRSAAPMKLWTVDRVETAEKSADWVSWLKASRVRRVAAVAVADRKRGEVAAMIEAVVIKIRPVPLGRARDRAINAYNAYNEERYSYDGWGAATTGSDPMFLERITVNYIRHECTRYDTVGNALFGVTGRVEAHQLLRVRVLAAIAARYPTLAAECGRQSVPRGM